MKSPSDIAPRYLSGFGNHFASEALPGALPQGRNSPQRCPYGLYAEQFSGTAFTAPRHANRRSWLYRIRPAAVHGTFRKLGAGRIGNRFDAVDPSPNRLRWSAPPVPRAPTDFLAGLATLGGNGSPEAHTGCAIYWYVANRSMRGRFFYDADGELLIVPQLGRLRLVDRAGGAGGRAAGDRRRSRAACASGSSCSMRPRVATCARTSGRRCGCRTWARSAPTGWRTRATSSPRSPGTRSATGASSWWRSLPGSCGRRRSATRRWMWSPGTATTRPTSTTCAVSTRWAR